MQNKNFFTKSRWLVTIILLLILSITNAWGTPTTIASWGCASYSKNTSYDCTGGNANNYSGQGITKACFSSDKDFTTSGTNAYYGSSSGGATIIFSHLNLSGFTNVKITFYSRASQGGNFALSYSTNNGSSWSTGNTSGTLATKNTPTSYSINFPTNSTSINAIKLTHSKSSGSLYFGTITITGEVPTITCATSSLTGFTYEEGSGPSTAQNFSVSATYLINNLTISATENYEIKKSTDGSYGSSVTLTPSTGTVSSTTINVRLKSGLSAGTRNGTITMSSSPASNKTISLSGSVTASGYTVVQVDIDQKPYKHTVHQRVTTNPKCHKMSTCHFTSTLIISKLQNNNHALSSKSA